MKNNNIDLLNCQIMISLSSLAEAKYRPSFDHRTQLTQAASENDTCVHYRSYNISQIHSKTTYI